jgi:hypothetical protein
MTAPNRIAMGIDSGGLHIQLKRPSRAMDAIWEAVSEAIAEGMTPERFRDEAAQAWKEELNDHGKRAYEVLVTKVPIR